MSKWPTPGKPERKFFTEVPVRFEWKFTASGTGEFEGYGAVFDVVDYYRDLIKPGAFAETLADHEKRGTTPAMLWFHDPTKMIGTWDTIREDEKGLFVAGRLDMERPDALKAYGSMKSDGSVDLSIGYTAMLFTIDRRADLRTITDIALDEISLAPRGAGVNPLAVVTDFKARAASVGTIRQFEELLRDAGFSRDRAKAIASGGFKAAADPRDEDGKAEALAGIHRLTRMLRS